jgi:hypothetical protein
LIRLNAPIHQRRDVGAMQRFPPAEDGPRFELLSLGQTLGDLDPADQVAPRPGNAILPLLWSATALLALIAFMGWLLVS